MSTQSLRKDHDLIQKVIQAMGTTIKLLKEEKKIPDSILIQTIDFAKNFTDVCHHSKEENSLFPALEKSGMPHNMGPIAMMLMEHEKSRQLASKMELSASNYFKNYDPKELIFDMEQYCEHITEHLWKENNRLFMMAEARLQYTAKQVNDELNQIEESKLKEIGKTRNEYEEIVEDLTSTVSKYDSE